MTQKGGPIGEGVKVTWVPSEPSAIDSKKVLEDFTLGQIPLTSPKEPERIIDDTKATQASIRQIDVLLAKAQENEQNAQKRVSLFGKMEQLGDFAKNHRWLTAGFVVAFFLLAFTTYCSVEALLGHTSLSFFQSHPELGGGLTFMCLYYSVYLINLCRRAKIKDDLEARIIAHKEFTEQLKQADKINLDTYTKKMNQEIKALNNAFIETHNNMQAAQKNVKTSYQEAKESLEKIKKQKEQLFALYVKSADSMPQKTRKQVEEQMVASANAINQGAKLLCPLSTATESLPEMPIIELASKEMILPMEETETMSQNQLKQQALFSKLNETLSAMGPFLKKNVFSGTLLMGGLLMCVFSGFALYCYFHGAESIFFFGSLSLSTLVPMIGYGLSLMYEGYNSATINSLQEELKKIDETNAARMKELQEEKKKLDEIEQTATTTLSTFTKKWTDFQNVESAYLKANSEALDKIDKQNWVLTSKINEFLLESFSPHYPDLIPQEVTRVVNEFQTGAVIREERPLIQKQLV